MILFAFTFAPALADSFDQPVQPTVTTTVENSDGIHSETKPYIEGQSSGVEYSGTATLTATFTQTALVLPPISPIPPSLLDDVIDKIKEYFPIILTLLSQLIREIVGWFVKLWNIRKSRKESEKEKTRPQPGVEISPALNLFSSY